MSYASSINVYVKHKNIKKTCALTNNLLVTYVAQSRQPDFHSFVFMVSVADGCPYPLCFPFFKCKDLLLTPLKYHLLL